MQRIQNRDLNLQLQIISLKVKLSLFLINLTPGYGDVGVNAGIGPLFLMSALDGGLPNT